MVVDSAEVVVRDSILKSIKKNVNVDPEDMVFDSDIIMYINSALSTLHQIGLGKANGFAIYDASAKWTDLLGTRTDLEFVKLYITYQVRLAFDPPGNSFGIDSMQKTITELTFRINVAVESAIRSYGDIYLISADADFPADAPSGAIGYDPVTDTVWRNN